MLKKFCVFQQGTKTSVYRSREKFLSTDSNLILVYCSDLNNLFQAHCIKTILEEDWWLFIDSSSASIKTIFIHIINTYSAIPIAYSIECKKT